MLGLHYNLQAGFLLMVPALQGLSHRVISIDLDYLTYSAL